MANIAASETNKFVGISALKVVKGGFAANFTLAEGATLTEIPVAEDGGFTYTGGEPSIEHYKIHGLTADWTSRTTPGETSVNLFVPSITKSLLQLFRCIQPGLSRSPAPAQPLFQILFGIVHGHEHQIMLQSSLRDQQLHVFFIQGTEPLGKQGPVTVCQPFADQDFPGRPMVLMVVLLQEISQHFPVRLTDFLIQEKAVPAQDLPAADEEHLDADPALYPRRACGPESACLRPGYHL